MNDLIRKLKETKVQLAVIGIFTFAVYANSLFNGLVWDDHLFLESWPQITDTKHIGEILKGSAPPAQDKVYRPLRGLIWMVDYQLWGANPFFYHLQAVLLHLTTTVLIYFVTRKIFGNLGLISFERRLAPIKADKRGYAWVPFVTALLFSIHPIHTETISYISASLETFGSLFFFGSLFLYLKVKEPISADVKLIMQIGSVVLAMAAFFTYEMTLVLPILFLLYEVLFHIELKTQKSKLKTTTQNLKLIAPYFVAAGVYLVIRTNLLGLISRTDYLGYSFYLTMLVMLKVIVRYIALLFVPFNQTAIHNLVGEFPSSMIPYDKLDPILSQTIFDFEVIGALIVLLGLLLVGIRMVSKMPILSFGIFWFLITLLPVSYIIPHGGAMAEKYLYIASFGFILAVLYLVYTVYHVVLNHKFVADSLVYLGIALLIFYSVSTVARNRVWKNDITLFSDVVKKSPNNLLANYNLGIWYSKEANLESAVSHYRRAIEKAPEFWEARYNLANVYLKMGKFEAASGEYNNVLTINPDLAPAKNILANFDLIKESTESANLSSDLLLVSYSKVAGLNFTFPALWSIEQQREKAVIKSPEGLTVEVGKLRRIFGRDFEDVVEDDKEEYGTMVNQGLAQIPNVEKAWVKVWSKPIEPIDTDLTDSAKLGQNQQNQVLLQFYLLGEDKVVKVLVWPADSQQMNVFDVILGSMKIS